MIPRISYFEPILPWFLAVGFTGLASAWRPSIEPGRPWLITVSLAGILLLSLNAVAWLIAFALEAWYPHNPTPSESADAIVILSGAVHRATTSRPYPLPAQDTYKRLQHGVWLFKHWKSVPILVSGGALSKDQPYAVTMRRTLESEG